MGVFDGIDDDMILQTVDNMDDEERDKFLGELSDDDRKHVTDARARQAPAQNRVQPNVDENEMAEYELEGYTSGYGSAGYASPREAEQNPSLMSEDGMIILDDTYTFAIDPYDKIYLYKGQDYRGMLPAPSGMQAGDSGSLVVSGGVLDQFRHDPPADDRDTGKERVYDYDREALQREHEQAALQGQQEQAAFRGENEQAEQQDDGAGDDRDKGKERLYDYDREALRAEYEKEHSAESESAEEEKEDTTGLLIDGVGKVLDGTYRFDVRRNGWLSLSQDGHDAGVMADPVGFPLEAFGSVRINRGVPETPEEYRGEYGQQALQGITPEELDRRNAEVFSAMFVDGAGEAQRTVRIVANSEHILLKNIREAAGGEPLPGNGPQTSGTVTFNRHRTRENELVIDGGVDVGFVRTKLRQLLDNPSVAYPYRDRRRVKIH